MKYSEIININNYLPFLSLITSVADPDPYVFGPPGSFYHEAKIVRKRLIPTVL
jgi:hypothetical protein